MNSYLTETLFSQLKSNFPAHAFLTSLMSDATVYLFGGAVRDFLDERLDTARDIDLVVESKSDSPIDILSYLDNLESVSYKKNRYDGYKINFTNHTIIDIWNLKDTWAFREKKLPPSAPNLMKSVYLNVDALVYSLNSDTFLDDCHIRYIDIIKKGLLDIVLEDTPYESLNLLRALVFQKKYSLNFSSKLNHRFIDYIENDELSAIDNFVNLQQDHYNQVLLDKLELAHAFRLLERHSS